MFNNGFVFMYNDVVTHAFRYCAPYVSSTIALLDHAQDDYSGSPEGTKRLAALLGISHSQTLMLLREESDHGINRLAYHYGFMPLQGSERSWRSLPMMQQPFDDGPRCRWDDRKIRYVRDVLTGAGEAKPSARVLAWRMDTTEDRLRDALRRRKISLRA